MKMVRDALGEDAIILSSESKSGKGATVTAAVEPSDKWEMASEKKDKPSPIPRPSPLSTNNHLIFEIQNILRFHNIPEHFISKIIHKASSKEFVSLSALHQISANRDDKPLVRHLLEKVLNEFFRYEPLSFGDGQLRIMLIGSPGIGKTLTIAKLATKLSMDQHPITILTTDNQRAGGVEQLQAFTDILEVPLYVTPSQEELASAVKNSPNGSHILIDTAGCNPYDDSELKYLEKLAQQPGIEPIMVLSAGGDSSETIDIVEAFSEIPIKRLFITRADTTRRFGGVLSAAAAHNLAFCNVSTSSSIVNSLEPVNGGALAQMLLRYQLQSR